MSEIIWEEMNEKLPWHKNDEELQMRKELWPQFDVNGNGYLSLAEVDKGMRDAVELPELFDIKPVLMRAFTKAKTMSKAKNEYGDDYVTKTEFRWLLYYIRQYYELWVAFDTIDTDDDRRVGMAEFSAAVPKLEEWGIDMSNPEGSFAECDENEGGQVLFEEFCDWAIQKHLDLQEDDDDDEL